LTPAWANSISIYKPGMVVHIWDPSYVGGHRREDVSLGPAPGKIIRPYLKNN
jgi:hypothetical protein